MLDTQAPVAQEAKQPAPLAPPTPTLPEAVDLLERNMSKKPSAKQTATNKKRLKLRPEPRQGD